jgi:hypothetical protein
LRIAFAQAYPTRPVRCIVGYAPGGGTDIFVRLVGQSLPARLGQPFVIENRAGATCPSRKSYPRIAMMQSGQDWYGDDGPRLLDGPS